MQCGDMRNTRGPVGEWDGKEEALQFTHHSPRAPHPMPPNKKAREAHAAHFNQRRRLLSFFRERLNLRTGLSYGYRNVLSFTRRMMQNVLAFRDNPIIPLRRSPLVASVGRSRSSCRRWRRGKHLISGGNEHGIVSLYLSLPACPRTTTTTSTTWKLFPSSDFLFLPLLFLCMFIGVASTCVVCFGV